MTKVTDLEANLEQFKIEQVAINSEAAKQLALLQARIEKKQDVEEAAITTSIMVVAEELGRQLIYDFVARDLMYPAIKEPMEVVHWLIFTSRMYNWYGYATLELVNSLVHGAPDVMDWIGLDLAWGQARAQAMVPDTHEVKNQRMLKRPPTAFLLFMKEFKEAQSNNKITTSVNSFANCSSTHTVAFASCSSTHTVAMAITKQKRPTFHLMNSAVKNKFLKLEKKR
ncbi:hypothetical protein Tco_1034981 [Tanacetum coccineum]